MPHFRMSSRSIMVGLKLKKFSGTKKETKKETKRTRTLKNLSKLVKLPMSKSKIT